MTRNTSIEPAAMVVIGNGLRSRRDRIDRGRVIRGSRSTATIPPETILGIQAAAWGIKQMKTKWGACNAGARRIWLNLELAKKPAGCLEYIIVHELTHLLDRHHDDRFIALMDQHLPNWRQRRQELNAAPLAHGNWSY